MENSRNKQFLSFKLNILKRMYLFIYLLDRVSQCIPGLPRTYFIDQADLKHTSLGVA